MKHLPDYSLIDQKATGARLKSVIRASGYRVSEIQHFLSFSGPQPIYRWFRGEALPSLHHLCALSGLLDVPVDDLLVREREHSAGSVCRVAYDCAENLAHAGKSSHARNESMYFTAGFEISDVKDSSYAGNCCYYRLSSEGAGAACRVTDSEPLQIDFEKLKKGGRAECATGMYGVALLARIYANKKCPEPESNQ